MSEGVQQPREGGDAAAVGGPLSRVFFVIGACGLLLAMASDFIAVLGRHMGAPFLGSIELVQASVVLATSSAMIVATLAGAHATVHVLLERLPLRGRAALETVGALVGTLGFAVLAAGSVWLVRDLWSAQERTELLGIPLLPLRLFWCASAVIVGALFLVRGRRAMRARPSELA